MSQPPPPQQPYQQQPPTRYPPPWQQPELEYPGPPYQLQQPWGQPPPQSLPPQQPQWGQPSQWGQYPPQFQPPPPWQHPYGQPPIQQWPVPSKKSRKGLWIALAIVAVAVVGNYFGYIYLRATDTTSSPLSQQQVTPLPTTAPTLSTSASGPAKIGQTITVNGLSCTLISVKIIPDDGVGLLKPGDEWVAVHVKIVNQTNGDYNYALGDFNIISGTGNATEPTPVTPSTYHGTQIAIVATLVSGGSTTGDIIFQAPKGDHKAELSWKPNFFGNTTDNVWELGL